MCGDVQLTIIQGRYLPVFAAEIYDNNKNLVKAGLDPINLNSIIMGEFGQLICDGSMGLTRLDYREPLLRYANNVHLILRGSMPAQDVPACYRHQVSNDRRIFHLQLNFVL